MLRSRRRRPACNGLFAPPLSLAEAEFDPPVVAARFEAVPAGASVLLRVHTDRPVDDAMLILQDDTGFDVLRPLQGSSGDTLGFAVPAFRTGASFWLDVRGRVQRLGAPELRAA